MPRARNGYVMPKPLPLGTVVEDIRKNKWQLGPSIGKGGFGEIYSAKKDSSPSKSFPYVVKIEPHGNGPLFVEMHFYMRNGKEDQIEEFKRKKKVTALGMPKYLGSGSYDHNKEKYRFVVMEKFGSDIWKFFIEHGRKFTPDTVFKLGVQILDVLEYIHSNGYIHADIKGANILMGLDAESDRQVYLVDFGLCTQYSTSEKPDPKKAHNGTIEYVSRDAHLGIESRRGDLECLGYNLVQWLGCSLPWETDLTNPKTVQQIKTDNMKNLPEFFKKCFDNEKPPAAIVDYMKYISTLKFETDPDYGKLRKILIKGIETAGGSLNSPFNFVTSTPSTSKRRSPTKSPSPKKKAKITTTKNKNTKAIAKKDMEEEDDNPPTVENNGTVDSTDYTEEIDEIKIKPKVTKRKPKNTKTVKGVKEDVKEEPIVENKNADDSTAGYTEEMRRIKKKLNEKKKKEAKAVVQTRPLRTRKEVNYREATSN